MQFRLFAGLLALLLAVPACVTSPTSTPSPPQEDPQFLGRLEQELTSVQKRYSPEEYLLGAGQATSEQVATDLARADLAKKIRVRVATLSHDFVRDRGGKTEQEISRLVVTKVDELITGSTIVAQGRDPESDISYAIVALADAKVGSLSQEAQAAIASHHKFEQASSATEPIWVSAEGVVAFGSDTTLAEAATRSRDEARRKAIEKAVGVFVSAQRVIYNAKVAEDLVRSVVRGIVIEEHIVDEGVRRVGEVEGAQALVYATSIRAKVEPVPLERAGGLEVDVALNRSVFQDGDEVRIAVRPSRDAYVYILNIGQDDRVTLLFPNKFAKDNFIKAEQKLTFPDQPQRNMGVRLRASLPQGERKAVERLKVLASSERLDMADGPDQQGVFAVHDGQDRLMVTDLMRQLALLDGPWTETTLPYEIRR